MDERQTIEQIVAENREDVEKLAKYLSWLQQKSGTKVMETFRGEGDAKLTMTVPVYDSTLLSFIKVAGQTKFMNKNYSYIYVKYKMTTPEDEMRMIGRAMITDMVLLGAILSKYVMKGMTKGIVWQEGIGNGVLYATVAKMKELIEFWEGTSKR